MVLTLLPFATYIHVCAVYWGRLHWGLWEFHEFFGYPIIGRNVHGYSGEFRCGDPMGAARPIPGFLDCTNATKVVVPTITLEKKIESSRKLLVPVPVLVRLKRRPAELLREQGPGNRETI